MIDVLLRKLARGAVLSSGDMDAVASAVSDVREVPAQADLILEGERPDDAHAVISGFACRYKLLPDGRRQIMAWLVPGDFCDLYVSILGEMDHSISALTPSRVAMIPRTAVDEMVDHLPNLARAFWWATLVDEGILREWLTNMGRRSAAERTGHLFCELHVRLSAVGLVAEDEMDLPLTQTDLADTLGLTPVHVNRVLRTLREEGLATWRSGRLKIHDLQRLQAVSDFNPNYLHLKGRHRTD